MIAFKFLGFYTCGYNSFCLTIISETRTFSIVVFLYSSFRFFTMKGLDMVWLTIEISLSKDGKSEAIPLALPAICKALVYH